MKKIIWMTILKNLQEKPHLKKKLKVVAVLGLVAFLFLGTLTAYLGFVGIRYVASVGKEFNVTEQAENIKTKINNLNIQEKSTCVTVAQGLLSLESLLDKPMRENVQALKEACFNPPLENREPAVEKDLI